MKPFYAFATAALLLTACMHSEETSREYPIATGRYSQNLASPENATFQVEYDQDSRLYLESQLASPGCAEVLYEGSWFVYTNVDYPETVLKKKLLRFAGGLDGTSCQTRDSLMEASGGYTESYWIRNITDSSFETCDRANEICFGKCKKKSDGMRDACYEFDSSRSFDSYWEYWRKS